MSRYGHEKGNEPIAIIGSGCRFPGEASTPSKLWELLRQPRDLSTTIPPDRFSAKGFFHPDGLHHGSSNVQESYFLSESLRHFDAQFFGIKPVEANATDPQQRLLLETVYESIESAGLRMEELRGSMTAVYVGLMSVDYDTMLLRDTETMPTYHATGVGRSIVSNRISYFFDWRGPSMTIDTACSSSLIAMHQAVQVLRSGDSRVAVAAGTNLILGPENYIAESKLKMLSPTGHSRMWDHNADGYARGEGVAAVVLKTLSSALEDGDHIECLVRETGINQDGRTKGITMPSASAQATLIRDTYAKAGLDLSNEHDCCQYFEAHGTGTPAGDPIEAEAIDTAFFGSSLKSTATDCTPASERSSLYVGSIKTVVGHTEGTAGIAAVLKASLALQHGVIPPNMLFTRLNPSIEPFYDNLEVPTGAKSWPSTADGHPRRASVNSFGFGGANAHAILESYNPMTAIREEEDTSDNASVFSPFCFSANSESSLVTTIGAYSSYLKINKSTDLRDLAWTLGSRRSALPLKASFSALTVESLCAKLDAKLEDTAENTDQNIGTRSSRISSLDAPRVLGVFTGQGAQWAGMGRDLILGSAFVRQKLESLEDRLADLPLADRPVWSLKTELLKDGSTSRLSEAAIAQPLCTAIQIVLVDLLHSAGIKLQAVVGHSSGEIGAAYAAGYVSAHDAICIAYYRGFHAHLACGPEGMKGAMMAVGTSHEDAQELCKLPYFEGRIFVAASNSSASVTISGDADAIHEAQVVFEDEKKFTRLLLVDKAYHSHHMIPCSKAYLKSLQACNIQIRNPSQSTWISSVYGEEITKVRADLTDVYWNSNMVRPVLFTQAIEKVFTTAGPFDIAVEIGPHPALKGPATQTMHDISPEINVPYTGLLSRGKNDIEACADGLGFFWSSIGDSGVDFESYENALSGGAHPRILKDLPPYSWEHDRGFWHESRLSRAFRTSIEPVHELLGRRCQDGTEQQLRWRNLLRPKEISWLQGHQLQDQMVFPAAGYVATALEASKVLVKDKSMRLIEVQDFVIRQAMVFNDDEYGIETLFTLGDVTIENEDTFLASFMYYSAVGKDSDAMTLMASGKLKVVIGEPLSEILPPRLPQEPNLVDIETDRFYTSLEQLGYGYTGPFKALSSMKRKLGMATGLVAKPATSDSERVLMVHPALLDAAIQSIILAFCYPDDGRLWSLHLPTSIRRIRVNPSLCMRCPDEELLLHFDSTLPNDIASNIFGDVDVYSDEQNAMFQMEGIECVPFSPASSANDTQLFSTMRWQSAAPNGEAVARNGRATTDEYELAYIAERLSFFYLRNLDSEIPNEHVARSNGSYKELFGFVSHVQSLVANGKHPYVKKEWVDDNLDQIRKASERYPESLDLKIIRMVGEHMPKVVKGQTTILEHLMVDNLLDDYYAKGLALPTYNTYLARMVCQIAHRYPHMNILEIGAGTGGAAKGVLNQLDDAFSMYNFTDISNNNFQKAQELLDDYTEKMTFTVLEIEKDISAQGFTEHSYDLIIASLALYATSDLENTMRNVHRLLKPGGYIIMLEMTDNGPMRTGFIFGALSGWRLGAEDGRSLSPCITSAQWDTLLRKTGFSGIDAITPDLDRLPYPASIIASQAMDDRISILRQPLSSSSHELYPPTLADHHLIILGGQTLKSSRLIGELRGLLKHHFAQVKSVGSLEEVVREDISSMTTIISLTELDEAIFKNMTAEKFEGLKQIFAQSTSILWITEGCRAENPYSNITIGFGRSQLWEHPDLRLQFLDIGTNGISTHLLAETFLRFKIASAWEQDAQQNNLLWSIEPEILLEEGQQLIPRLVSNSAQNDRYNSSRRVITKDIDPQNSPVAIAYSAASPVLQEGWKSQALRCPETTRHIVVKVSHSVVSSLKIATTGSLFLLFGTITNTAEQVIALSLSQTSIARVPETWSVPCHVAKGQEAQFISSVTSNLLALSLMIRLSSGDTLLVHDAKPAFASILDRRASENGIQVVHTTSKSSALYPHATFIHPCAPRRSVQAILPVNVKAFIDLSGGSCADSVASHIAACVSLHCIKENTSSLFGKEAYVYSSSTDSIQDLLRTAWLKSHEDTLEDQFFGNTDVVALSDIPDDRIEKRPSSIVSWAAEPTVPVKIEPVDSQRLFAPDKTYWLVGLTRGLGLSLCEWMVRHGAKYVVLTSRDPRIDQIWVRKMKTMGATVKFMSNDITNKHDVETLYKEICSTLPPIAGVAQGAMVLRDTPTRDMTIDKMQDVLRPKVDGSVYLHELFSENNLDFFIFFSSMVAVIGNIGQSNYSAANAFMASLAAQRRKRGLAGSVINIGAILGIGFITRELSQANQDNLRKGGYMWLSEQDFHQLFAEAVLAGHPESRQEPEISTGMRHVKANGPYKPTWINNPRFQHHVLEQADADLGDSNSKASIPVKTRLLAATRLEQVYEILKESLISKLQSMLQFSAESLGNSRSLVEIRTEELGIDSLNAVEIRSWFLKTLDVNMPVLKILGGASIGDLLDHALKTIPEELVPGLQTTLPSKDSESSTGSSTPPDSSSNDSPISSGSSASGIEDSTSMDMKVTSASLFSESELSLKDSISRPFFRRTEAMSFGQSMFWFVNIYLEDKTTLNHTGSFHIKGNLRVKDLERAVQVVGQRHEALRTCFFADEDNQLLQGILESPLLHLEKRKINDESEVEREFESMRQHVFDIQRGEIMRIVLLSLTSVEHYLVIGAHHINVDGISQQVLMADLEKAYSRQAMSSDILQYPDFSLRQQEDFKAGNWETDLTFWRNEFPDFPPPLPLLPLSEITTRRALKKYAAHRVDFRIEASFAAHIQKISRQFNATPFHFYLAVFKTLLFRYVGTDDLCIGMGDGNRSESEMFESIGPYVNLLPLRFRSRGSQTFSDTLQEARIKTYSALAHSRPPFEVLLTELGVPRSATQSPLFQAFIDYRQATREKHSFGNCEFELKDFQAGRTAYDISLDIIDSASGEVLLMFMVQEDLYKLRDAEILMSSYLSLLKSFSNDPALSLSQPALFESTEIDQAIQLGKGPTLQSEWPETLTHRVDAVTQSFGERTAVRDSEGNSLTYARMAKRVECIAASLLAADVGSGSRVAVFQEPTSDYICSLLAIMRIGAACLPLDMGTPLQRLAVIVNDCQPGAILSHNATKQHVPILRSQNSAVINVSALSESDFIPCSNRAMPDSPAVILYTSGSTGIPKGILLKHSSLRNEIEFSSHVYGFGCETVLLQSALSFDMSLTQIFTAIAYGGMVYVAPRSSRGDPIALTKLIASEAISFTGATPSEYISWLRYGEMDSLRASQWKFAVSGGEQVTEALREAFRTQNKRELRLFNAYGPTEITCSSNKLELFYADVDYSGSRIPAGFTTPNYSVYIVDENLNAVPRGVPGEILVGGAGVALGYLNNDDLTAERFIPDKFASTEYISKGWTSMHRTGDKGRFQDNGSILIEGRIVGDTQVKLRGLRIELQDVENAILETANGALTGVVVSVRRLAPLDSEFLVAHVAFSPSYPPEERGRCLRILKSGLPLPQYMCPAMIIPIDRLLLSTSSKLDRLAIGSLPLPHSQETDSDPVELSETEAQLKSIWEVVISKEITDFHTINAETDFFHIGGNSLLLVNLQALLKKKFHISLSLVQLFESSTLRTMALRIESSSQTIQRISIDWDSETQLLPDLLELTLPSETENSRNDPKVVVLTGATGFLGKVLLRHLLNTEGIQKIHCVAMRTTSSLQSLPNSSKVVFHDGDLTLPRLGLSEEESRKLFNEVDAIIHNGADVSHLKSFQTLRSANLDSTRELVRMSLPRLIPIHYISTAGVALFSEKDTFGEISAAPYPPPIDGSDGYTASKWASERYLEKVAEKFPVSVCIHRPSSIMRDDTPELDILQNLLRYSRLMEAVPVSPNLRGALDLVSVDNVAGSVVHELCSQPTQSGPGSIRYFNQTGDLDIPLPGLKAFLDAESGKDVATLGITEWVGRAKSMGMHSVVAAFFENVESMGVITFPKLIKRTV